MKHVTIKISGAAASGKSRTAECIAARLRENGAEVNLNDGRKIVDRSGESAANLEGICIHIEVEQS